MNITGEVANGISNVLIKPRTKALLSSGSIIPRR